MTTYTVRPDRALADLRDGVFDCCRWLTREAERARREAVDFRQRPGEHDQASNLEGRALGLAWAASVLEPLIEDLVFQERYGPH